MYHFSDIFKVYYSLKKEDLNIGVTDDNLFIKLLNKPTSTTAKTNFTNGLNSNSFKAELHVEILEENRKYNEDQCGN